MTEAPGGRPKKYCKHSCRQRAYESRKYGIEEVWGNLRRQYDSCYLCDERLDWNNHQGIVMDHMVATVWGGRTVPENLRPVHAACNTAKGSRLLISSLDTSH